MRCACPSARVGVISDTHGLLRPEALAVLQGSDHILHAGDIGGPQILAALRELAPVTAVRGNNDTGAWARRLRESEVLEIAGSRICVVHQLALLEADPVSAGYHVVISGHSHRPSRSRRAGVLYLNPGSAGPRRFSLPVAVALLSLPSGRATLKML